MINKFIEFNKMEVDGLDFGESTILKVQSLNKSFKEIERKVKQRKPWGPCSFLPW